MNLSRRFFGKSFLFTLLTFTAIFVLLEMISYAGLAVLQQSLNVRESIRKQQIKGLSQKPARGFAGPFNASVQNEKIHPYLGYVQREKTSQDAFGFGNAISPIQKKSQDKVILAVLGGSLADELFKTAIQDLVHELQQSNQFQGKEIVPVNLAMSGYKQPQQLMTIHYFLTLGGEFDIVVNLDGFNDATSPIVENRLAKVPASYPHEWRVRTDPLEPWALETFFMKNLLAAFRLDARYFFTKFPLSESYTAMLVWKVIDRSLAFGMNYYHKKYFYELSHQEIEPLDAFNEELSHEESSHDLTDIWKLASLSIGASAKVHQFDYYHFLQPNLNFDGTKIWSRTEQRFRHKNIYLTPVNQIYPLLQEKGRELTKAGEKFYDMTAIFEGRDETLYSDDCCHLSSEGYKILAKHLGRIIVKNFSEKNKDPGSFLESEKTN